MTGTRETHRHMGTYEAVDYIVGFDESIDAGTPEQ